VPKSKIRKRDTWRPTGKADGGSGKAPKPVRIGSGRWVAPTMCTLFLLGLLWIVVFYITRGDVYGMRTLGNWNILVGFGFVGAGFVVSTRWK
jgi:hypothetical protein